MIYPEPCQVVGLVCWLVWLMSCLILPEGSSSRDQASNQYTVKDVEDTQILVWFIIMNLKH